MTSAECGACRFGCRWTIRSHLTRAGLTMSDLARRIDVTPEAVSATVKGRMHSPRVLDALRSVGVPEKILFDPRKSGEEAA